MPMCECGNGPPHHVEEPINLTRVLSNSPETLTYLVQVLVRRISKLEEKVKALESKSAVE
jgi:hypothetical protein